ncbi:MAG TPA: carbonic anhydrase [Bacteroidetes bacterium]|nr:carbonic anhydrase [Bacteroidota bacterium]
MVQNKAQSGIAPMKALQLLKEGNQRFLNGPILKRGYANEIKETAIGQHPFAIILSCIDSRVPVENIFDLRIGEVFVARIGGNIVNGDVLGSMEFACRIAGSGLVLVLGHTFCGAVSATCDHVHLGNLSKLLQKIKPAVEAVITPKGVDRSAQNQDFVNQVAEMNVRLVLDQIKQRSPLLNEMLVNGEIDIAGAMYDIENGKVSFL